MFGSAWVEGSMVDSVGDSVEVSVASASSQLQHFESPTSRGRDASCIPTITPFSFQLIVSCKRKSSFRRIERVSTINIRETPLL